MSENPLYKTKNITFGGNRKILMQLTNGPPTALIAICNILLLRKEAELTGDYISEGDVVAIIENHLRKLQTAFVHDQTTQQQYEDAIALIGKLGKPIDVNLKVTHIKDFVRGPETSVFELVGVDLYHGWLPDPEEEAHILEKIGTKSYNTLLLEFPKSADVPEKQAVYNFMGETCGPLTAYGLQCLKSGFLDGNMCILFWKGQFNTVFKLKGELYLLATDDRYADKPENVWQKLELDGVNGEGNLFNNKFKESPNDRGKRKGPESNDDFGWFFVDSMDNNSRSNPKCMYCDYKTNTINRIKKHLVGGYKEARACSVCPEDVRMLCNELLKITSSSTYSDVLFAFDHRPSVVPVGGGAKEMTAKKSCRLVFSHEGLEYDLPDCTKEDLDLDKIKSLFIDLFPSLKNKELVLNYTHINQEGEEGNPYNFSKVWMIGIVSSMLKGGKIVIKVHVKKDEAGSGSK